MQSEWQWACCTCGAQFAKPEDAARHPFESPQCVKRDGFSPVAARNLDDIFSPSPNTHSEQP